MSIQQGSSEASHLIFGRLSWNLPPKYGNLVDAAKSMMVGKKKLDNREVLQDSVWQDCSMHKKKPFYQIRSAPTFSSAGITAICFTAHG
jgi:hypothetical protein